ncbi:phenylalanine--tRNA ligase subunit beta [Lacipirellula parvula]|uniref:Phenylalanine--tRNA ligase beta subunit n=1 Tax=Lacipirellula parvula TaxID=2650471 RepID=A0A5K7X6M6_9BACT|nr:phenylalanine--tRNA ligase subunit beta [Lacipirellula parvula]BBO31497.1 phenylalanyl-tRNA synthetase beta chain [Lacipirellula parvula]
MIVSLDWLRDYVAITMPSAELADRFALSGLNFESASDEAIDLEVTSNRPDCLGHIGVAREVGVLYDLPIAIPAATVAAKGPKIDTLTSVTIEAPELCPRYTARLIRGVKIGPSPAWLADRLRTLGIAVINNVVDVTNYVMFECGQPLHAFDFAKLSGGKIIVRAAKPGEKFQAINHQEYELAADTCVIADAKRPVAVAGVMGGVDSEVTDATVDVLIESAAFAPLSVRTTARRHHLHSPSSYRFERSVDLAGLDWASRRACELILQTAGGTLAEGVIDVGPAVTPKEREVVKLRWAQLPRVLGIEVPVVTVQKILTALGCEETHICDHCIKVLPPSWRADLTREIDLIEEVARIYGYDQIPEDSNVKMAASTRTRLDRVLDRVRATLTAAGFDEAMTLSAVDETLVDAIQPWSDEAPLRASTAVLRRADCLRQTLVPSLLTARRHNEKLSNPTIELFEIANVYLPIAGEIPQQKRLLAITSGGGFLELKGILEALVARIAPSQELQVGEVDYPLLDDARQCRLRLGEHTLGYLGELSKAGRERFELRGGSTVAEIDVEILIAAAELAPTAVPLSQYPPVSRDVNIVVNETIRWSEVERLVRTAGGDLIESVQFQETYRDAQRLGAGKKSLLFSLQLRSATATLTNEEADAVRARIVEILSQQVGGELRA